MVYRRHILCQRLYCTRYFKHKELNHLVSGSEYDGGNLTPLALNYTGIQPYLTKAVQELHALLLQQSQLISQQGQQILDLSAQLAALP